jgi:hypothetical protein
MIAPEAVDELGIVEVIVEVGGQRQGGDDAPALDSLDRGPPNPVTSPGTVHRDRG